MNAGQALSREWSRARRRLGTAVGRLIALVAPVALIGAVGAVGTAPARADFFDAHLHYHPAQADTVSPEAVAGKFDRAGIRAAVVLAPEPELVVRLRQQTEARILPFLDVSRRLGHRLDWMHQTDLGARTAAWLDASAGVGWMGLGELHIMAEDRFGSGFAELLALAVERNLVVMIHGDPAVIDRAFELQPGVRILWAHAGSFPYPPLIADYLERYPNLSMDLSMRNPRIATGPELDPAWFELFLDHPQRFMLGVDTFSLRRWEAFDTYYAEVRAWLGELPEPVAHAIALDNGLQFFGLADVEGRADRDPPVPAGTSHVHR